MHQGYCREATVSADTANTLFTDEECADGAGLEPSCMGLSVKSGGSGEFLRRYSMRRVGSWLVSITMLSRVCDTVGEEDRRLGNIRKQRDLDHHSVYRLEIVESVACLWTARHRHIPHRSCKTVLQPLILSALHQTFCLKGGEERCEEHEDMAGTGIVLL